MTSTIRLCWVLCFLLVFVFAVQRDAFAQSNQQPLLIDEFDRISCEEHRGRFDSFLTELSNNPNWSGVVVNRGDKIFQLLREDIFRNQAVYRNFDIKRISFIRTAAGESNQTQFWRLPPGVKFPIAPTDVDAGFMLTESRPRLLFSDDPYAEVECGEVKSRYIFASILKANPAARANIVMRFMTLARSQREQTRLLDFFIRRNGIERKRIRAFLRKQRRNWNERQPAIEYWYLP